MNAQRTLSELALDKQDKLGEMLAELKSDRWIKYV